MSSQWIDSEGGPLIVISDKLIPSWEGTREPTGRTLQASFRWDDPEAPATDYDRACDVGEAVGCLEVGEGSALVLGDEPLSTTLVRRQNGVVFVRWASAESEEAVELLLGNLPTSGFVEDPAKFVSLSGAVSVFDAAYSSEEIEDCLAFELGAGVYRVSSQVWEPDSESVLLLHELNFDSALSSTGLQTTPEES